jgi:DNA repair protein RecO (recombination protein O)
MPTRERSIRSEALVLRHSDWGEADRMLVVFTDRLGKLRALAKGARKPRSRKAGHLEPFTLVTIQLAKGRDLFIITQAETKNAYLGLRNDLISMGQAVYVLELLDRFTYEEEENSTLFRLAVRTLDRLLEEPDRSLVLRYYEMRILDLLGFRPELLYCTSCKEEIQAEDQYFSAEKGGILCPRCGKTIAGARVISLRALKYLRHFQRSNFDQAKVASPGPGVHLELESIMDHYLTYLLERSLNSPAFLRQMRSVLNRPAHTADEELDQHEEPVIQKGEN